MSAVEDLRERAAAAAKQTARELELETIDGLDSYRKPELVELAAGIGIEGRTTMTKSELLDAITKATRGRRRQRTSA